MMVWIINSETIRRDSWFWTGVRIIGARIILVVAILVVSGSIIFGQTLPNQRPAAAVSVPHTVEGTSFSRIKTSPGTPHARRQPTPALALRPQAISTANTAVQPADQVKAVSSAESLGLDRWLEPNRMWGTLKTVAVLSMLSLAPAVLLMTTSYVRIVVVLGLLRQGLGPQVLPSNQVVSTLAIFLTLVIMGPVWKQSYENAIVPYTEGQADLAQTWEAGVQPIRRFMTRQIDQNGNRDDIWLFYEYMNRSDFNESSRQTPTESIPDDVPLTALLPAFMLSELKTAFLIGFQVYLPFLIIDVVVASVTVSMGMVMLPPSVVSLPFKLLLFVLVDGWHLVVQMLLQSFSAYA